MDPKDQEIARLREENRRLKDERDAEQSKTRTETGGGAYIKGDVKAGRNVAGRDYVEQQHIHVAETTDLGKAEEKYRRQIASRCGEVPLHSLEVSPEGGEAEPLSLAEIYISLDTRQSASVESIEAALQEVARGRLHGLPRSEPSGREPGREQETRPVSALEAAIFNLHLVLTGEPGSGKSTFVNHLTVALAQRRWACLPGWPERERDALPVPVALRDFTHWLSTNKRKASGACPDASANLLWEYIVYDLMQWQLEPAKEVLQQALEDGHAVVLLDGLDEVPADDAALLGVVKTSVQRFVDCYRDSRHLITCRVLSYQESHWRFTELGFPDLELARFSEEQIDRFIGAWYREVGAKWKLSPDQIETLAGKLRQAVRRPELWRLAPNPLLLTVMALVHSRQRELPEQRALLYDEAVDILLRKREQDKTLDLPRIQELLSEAGRNFNDLKGVLEVLAFETHQSGRTVRDEQEDGGPIDTLKLRDRVAALHPKGSQDWALQLLDVLRLRASLLLERTDEVFSFPHRTFQEYLAGVHLARLGSDDFVRRAMELSGDRLAYWREVILLAVGYLVHSPLRDTGKPRLLAEELCPERSPETDEDWRQIWLAGDVLREVGVNRVRDTEQGKGLLRRVTGRLTMLVEQGELTARERAEAGDVLGELGDPRFDPELFYLPCCYWGEAEPLAGFVAIAPGPFVMGEGGDRQDLSIDYPYWMARYPVTVEQFGRFVDAGGYDTETWWTEAGRAWLDGSLDSQIEDSWARYVLDQRPVKLRGKPMRWVEQRTFSNRSVTGVSWFEAMAYCRWLDHMLRESGKVRVLEDAKYVVRLPTEAEWEKAARCADERDYPWGDEKWDEERANIDASEINHPSSVGMYPNGATATSSLHDVSGNVWEWGLSLYQNYPYRPEDGRNDLNSPGARVVRGGSWANGLRYARCAVRSRYRPVQWLVDRGFRLVLSLADSEF